MGWPLVTADLGGTGGVLRTEPEDFEVEELPLYPPSGEGEHLFVWLEKRNRTTPEVAAELAEHLGVGADEVGWAGMKDRLAVTRQYLSVPARAEMRLGSFSLDGVRVLSAVRHRNKLKPGHLAGNRFRIRVRKAADVAKARPVLERLLAIGVPNYFGEQRFGSHEKNAELGRRLLCGEHLRAGRFERRLYLSAFQSLLFNRALAERVSSGTWNRALEGDVLKKHDTGGEFVCLNAEAEQRRVERFEVSPAGPMFGPRMTKAAGEVAAFEERLLAREGLTLADFARERFTQGARRFYRVPLADASLVPGEGEYVVRFTLPKGSYATVVLAELTKQAMELSAE